jgi:hypothetical protein
MLATQVIILLGAKEIYYLSIEIIIFALSIGILSPFYRILLQLKKIQLKVDQSFSCFFDIQCDF